VFWCLTRDSQGVPVRLNRWFVVVRAVERFVAEDITVENYQQVLSRGAFQSYFVNSVVIATPLATWLLKGYFDDIPEALDEAAKMDGCSQLDILVRVILPLSIPGIAVAGFYTFTVSWNDFLLVSVLSQTSATRTLPLGLQLFQSQNQVAWHLVLTAAVVTMAPVILLFALVQKWVVEGLGSGGMKGV